MYSTTATKPSVPARSSSLPARVHPDGQQHLAAALLEVQQRVVDHNAGDRLVHTGRGSDGDRDEAASETIEDIGEREGGSLVVVYLMVRSATALRLEPLYAATWQSIRTEEFA